MRKKTDTSLKAVPAQARRRGPSTDEAAMMPLLAFDDDSAPLYTVGQVAEMLDVRQAFLRRLDTFAIVEPARSEGDQRRYSRDDVARVQAAVSLIGEGVNLVGIRRVLDLEGRVRELETQLTRLRGR